MIDSRCTYGALTSLDALENAVLLESDIESKAFAAAELQANFK
jgi:hypothetical protein